MTVTKYEKETVITFNEREATASVYTFNTNLKHRLASFSVKYPALCRLQDSDADGSVAYDVDKKRLSIRLIPPYPEERKRAASVNAKALGIGGRRTPV